MRISGHPPTPIAGQGISTNPLLALSRALTDRDEDGARTLLARVPSLAHAVDGKGNGALHLAVHAGASAAFVRALLQAGADPLRANGDGNTALHLAVARAPGQPDTVSALLSAGGLALADRADRQGRGALECARRHGSAAVVDGLIADIHLLERCEDWGQGPSGLRWVGYAEALDGGALRTLTHHVMELGGVNAADGRGMTVLMRAAEAGRADLVAWLLERGAEVNAICHCRRTGIAVSPLMCGLTSAAVTRLLIAWGADPAQPHRPPARWFERPQTVLHVAAMGAVPEAMAAVLAARRRPAWHDADLGAALLAALRNGAPQLAFAVLEYSGRLDARTMREAMPLAVAAGSRELVHLLLALGADASAADANGGTVLDIAVERGDEQMAMLLVAQGAATRRTHYPGARRLSRESCLVQ